MKAVTVVPLERDSAELTDVEEPGREPPETLLVEMICVGVCGTDREILAGEYGEPPPGRTRLVLGHESLGRVLAVPAGGDWSVGDLAVGIVRHPDPVPCPNCAVGEWDMCRNGRYTEHGIKGRDGFLRERYALDPGHAVRIDPGLGELGVLLEPASVLAKAWEHIERIGARARFEPRTVLVTGGGPVGLLAAMMGRQKDLEVWILDRNRDGRKPELARRLGARYATDVAELGADRRFDVALECTGAGPLVIEVMRRLGPNGVACLTGVSSGGRTLEVDAAELGREIVLENAAVFGSVNANRRHYERAAHALARADRDWLAGMITRRVPLPSWREALERGRDDVKVVITGPGAERR
ncbi:MAG TPA: glucose 1-dehydrogenase [Gemmatimonadales bacterium]|nr:glucose 1-dehydrogenase [Gemmatimonadales bacterium]